MTRLYVGNIRYSADEASLRAVFEAFGQVQSVFIALDRETGRSRGFAFVTMADANSAAAARDGLNGKEVEGRVLVVNDAQPRPARGAGGPDGAAGSRDRVAGSRERSPDRGSAQSGFRSERAGDRAGGRSGDRGGDGTPSFRRSPYAGPPPEGRPSRGGKGGERDRDRDRDRVRDQDRGRNRQRFDQDDEW